jgi:hypothetical protein
MGLLRALTVAALIVLGCGIEGSAAPLKTEGKTKTSRWFELPPGRTTRTFTMRRPSGIVRLTRITTTYGIRASVTATVGRRLMAVSVSNDSERYDPARRCRREGSLMICSQNQEGCPAPAAAWRVQLEKLSGPRGLVRFDFVVSR